MIPTKAGTYSFIFSGTVNGDAVNETFESGPGRFDDVESPTGLQFPPVAGAADPTQQAQAANDAAQTALQRATLLGGGGLLVGVIGLIVGVVALTSRARI